MHICEFRFVGFSIFQLMFEICHYSDCQVSTWSWMLMFIIANVHHERMYLFIFYISTIDYSEIIDKVENLRWNFFLVCLHTTCVAYTWISYIVWSRIQLVLLFSHEWCWIYVLPWCAMHDYDWWGGVPWLENLRNRCNSSGFYLHHVRFQPPNYYSKTQPPFFNCC